MSVSVINCAVYTRKSSEHGLEQAFNSLDAQREASSAYVSSQKQEGWKLLADHYDDGGFSGGSMERPALVQLMGDVRAGKVDVIVVYKIDRLTRSLSDFARMVDVFDKHDVSFVSVTQQFNTTSSMGRLTLNVLLSFAQFEREVTGERIRDKIEASRKRGMWMGGTVPLGYDALDKKLVINEEEAETVRILYNKYLELGSVRALKDYAAEHAIISKRHKNISTGKTWGGRPLSRGALYTILKNRIYLGEVVHKGESFPGEHAAIIEPELWDAVQQRLRANSDSAKLRRGAKAPSLLAGILFDDKGNRMSPSHATKGDKRYRYYTSQALLQNREQEAGSIARIPAGDIERLVLEGLKDLLCSPTSVIEASGVEEETAAVKKALMDRTRELGQSLITASPAEQIDMITCLIERVVVSADQITIHVEKHSLRAVVEGKNVDDPVEASTPAKHPYSIVVLARLRRCGGETRLIIAGKSDSSLKPNPKLIRALAKAWEWNRQLISGEASSVSDIAKRERIARRHVGRRLKLAWLAPDIIEGILDGEIPADLTINRILTGLPLDWQQQLGALGFGSNRG